MRRNSFCLLIFLTFLICAGKGLQADLTSEAVGKIRLKMAEYQQQILDLHTTQEIEIFTPQGEMVQQVELFQKGRKFRVNLASQIPGAAQLGMESMNTVLVTDGTVAWMISPLTGRIQVPLGESLKYYSQSSFWNFVDLQGIQVKAVADVRGRACYVLEVGDENTYPMIFWVDRETLDILQSEFQSEEGAFQATYSDFRIIQGNLSLPHHVEIYQNGELLSTATLQSVQINSGLADQYFDANQI